MATMHLTADNKEVLTKNEQRRLTRRARDQIVEEGLKSIEDQLFALRKYLQEEAI